MIDQLKLMQVLAELRDEAVVMPVFRANPAWNQVSKNPKLDVPIGTSDFPAVMGIGSSFALGFCLARPETKVILLDGDGSLLMNLGSLVTVFILTLDPEKQAVVIGGLPRFTNTT